MQGLFHSDFRRFTPPYPIEYGSVSGWCSAPNIDKPRKNSIYIQIHNHIHKHIHIYIYIEYIFFRYLFVFEVGPIPKGGFPAGNPGAADRTMGWEQGLAANQ